MQVLQPLLQPVLHITAAAQLAGTWVIGSLPTFEDEAVVCNASVVGEAVRFASASSTSVELICRTAAGAGAGAGAGIGAAGSRMTVHELHRVNAGVTANAIWVRWPGLAAVRLAADVLLTRDPMGQPLHILCRPGIAELMVPALAQRFLDRPQN